MIEKQIIYTYGNEQITPSRLLSLLKQHNINCVVDCRPYSNNTFTDHLKEPLQKENIIYIPFFNHFGYIPSQARTKQGNINYKKAIVQEHFLKGTERIKHGLEKGYTICIIDNQSEINKSKRFLLIGKYFTETHHIIHLFDNGYHLSQEQIELQNIKKAAIRQQKNNEKQSLGRNGEEIAALYLSRNGYQILDRNWNLHHGCELDIVALKNNKLHFIEVKTRTSDKYGEPQLAINRQKIKNIEIAIQLYRSRRKFISINYQIDSIAIIYHSNNDYILKHFLDIRPNGDACDSCQTYIP